MTIHTWPSRDPRETLDYTHDWSARLATDAIASVSAVGRDVSVVSTSFTGTTQTVRLTGGTVGAVADVSLFATGTSGQVYEEGVRVKIREHGGAV